jgi:hypothetical protein
MWLPAYSGNAGKSLVGKPMSSKFELRDEMRARVPLSSKFTVSDGGDRMIVATFFAGKVIAPSEVTFALTLHRIPRSRFIVVNATSLSAASIKTLLKLGIVSLVETTFIPCCNPLTNALFSIEHFMT